MANRPDYSNLELKEKLVVINRVAKTLSLIHISEPTRH